ncbi:hypothetical protein [Gellertiella hungarica]|uniref:Uncharacterized protein n=1 Tax=Gellertiella hungarica TaxID=1572859 RepID=A0A7W6JB08_9HYPH|nr:hypothetical protein [Gellertiella hungarica]MBB4067157.1 hypothetical protein [Gellertiella hungarica]
MKKSSRNDPKTKVGTLECKGDYAGVRLFGEAYDEFHALDPKTDELSVKKLRTISRYFERFVALGPTSLNEKMFKKQSRIKIGGTEVMIWEFKAWQFRIYGVIGEYEGQRCFLGTACDPDKKKDKADPAKLRKAAEEYLRITNG